MNQSVTRQSKRGKQVSFTEVFNRERKSHDVLKASEDISSEIKNQFSNNERILDWMPFQKKIRQRQSKEGYCDSWEDIFLTISFEDEVRCSQLAWATLCGICWLAGEYTPYSKYERKRAKSKTKGDHLKSHENSQLTVKCWCRWGLHCGRHIRANTSYQIAVQRQSKKKMKTFFWKKTTFYSLIVPSLLQSFFDTPHNLCSAVCSGMQTIACLEDVDTF